MFIKVLAHYFFYFILYSVFGWIYETVLVSLEQGRIVNRGFLNGPYCPIYGVGSLIFITLLGQENSVILIFLFGALIASALEYFTATVLETLFNAKWWDYSRFKFNLKGRICLGAAAVFGVFAVLLVKFIHPFFLNLFKNMPGAIITALIYSLLFAFIIDVVASVKGAVALRQKNFYFEAENDQPAPSLQEKRLLKAFPKLTASKTEALKK